MDRASLSVQPSAYSVIDDLYLQNTHKTGILFLFYEPSLSGITRHVTQLLKGLSVDKYTSRVLCSSSDERIVESLSNLVGNERLTVVPPSRFFSVRGFLQGYRIIRDNRIEILHVHNMQSALWGYLAGLTGGSPRIVFTPHVTDVGGQFVRLGVRAVLRALGPFTDKLIALSNSQASRLRERRVVPPGKLRTILNRVDEAEILSNLTARSDMTRAKIGVEPNRTVVCQVGRLTAQKNPHFLVRAAEIAVAQDASLLFLLVGEGPERASLQREVEGRGLGEHVRLLGFRRDVIEILNASDIVTLTSRWEGLPYTLIEAIALSKPIVATDVTGNIDLVDNGENGFLVRSEEEFAARVTELSRSLGLRSAMGRRGYETRRDLFDIQGMVREMEAVYDEARDARKSSPAP